MSKRRPFQNPYSQRVKRPWTPKPTEEKYTPIASSYSDPSLKISKVKRVFNWLKRREFI